MPKQVSIQIEHALYGFQDKTVDVTEQTQNALMGDDLTISAKRLGIDDPAPGESKFFAVKATITIDNNKPQTFHYIAKDYQTIDFIP